MENIQQQKIATLYIGGFSILYIHIFYFTQEPNICPVIYDKTFWSIAR